MPAGRTHKVDDVRRQLIDRLRNGFYRGRSVSFKSRGGRAVRHQLPNGASPDRGTVPRRVARSSPEVGHVCAGNADRLGRRATLVSLAGLASLELRLETARPAATQTRGRRNRLDLRLASEETEAGRGSTADHLGNAGDGRRLHGAANTRDLDQPASGVGPGVVVCR